MSEDLKERVARLERLLLPATLDGWTRTQRQLLELEDENSATPETQAMLTNRRAAFETEIAPLRVAHAGRALERSQQRRDAKKRVAAEKAAERAAAIARNRLRAIEGDAVPPDLQRLFDGDDELVLDMGKLIDAGERHLPDGCCRILLIGHDIEISTPHRQSRQTGGIRWFLSRSMSATTTGDDGQPTCESKWGLVRVHPALCAEFVAYDSSAGRLDTIAAAMVTPEFATEAVAMISRPSPEEIQALKERPVSSNALRVLYAQPGGRRPFLLPFVARRGL